MSLVNRKSPPSSYFSIRPLSATRHHPISDSHILSHTEMIPPEQDWCRCHDQKSHVPLAQSHPHHADPAVPQNATTMFPVLPTTVRVPHHVNPAVRERTKAMLLIPPMMVCEVWSRRGKRPCFLAFPAQNPAKYSFCVEYPVHALEKFHSTTDEYGPGSSARYDLGALYPSCR